MARLTRPFIIDSPGQDGAIIANENPVNPESRTSAEAFLDWCGFVPEYNPEAFGVYQRFSFQNSHSASGWLIVNRFATFDSITAGDWGNHVDSVMRWSSKPDSLMSEQEKAERESAWLRFQRDTEEGKNAAALVAEEIYRADYRPAPDNWPYLQRKQAKNHGGVLRLGHYFGKRALMIPLMDIHGKIRTLEFILEDGSKRFLAKGEKKGNFLRLGKQLAKDERGSVHPAYLCEGYATASSVYQATGVTTVVAFDKGNLGPVADALSGVYSFVVVADNDASGAGEEAAKAAGLPYKLVPEEGMDANDYACAYGLEALREFLFQKPWLQDAATFMKERMESRWLVKDWMPAGTFGMVFGDPGSGKSLVVLDMVFALASGRGNWFGFRAKRAKCLYLAGEGRAGVQKRLKLLCQENYIPPESLNGWLYVSTSSKNLNETSDISYVLAEIDKTGFMPDFVVVDTLSRHYSGDENKAEQMKLLIEGCESLINRYGCACWLIHHTGVADKTRARGSTSMLGALDVSILCTKEDDVITFEQRKMKDWEKLPPYQFMVASGEIRGWIDEDGNPDTAPILRKYDRESRSEDVVEKLLEDPSVREDTEWIKNAWMKGERARNPDGWPMIMKTDVQRYLKEEQDKSKTFASDFFRTDSSSRHMQKLKRAGLFRTEGDGADLRLILADGATNFVWVQEEKRRFPKDAVQQAAATKPAEKSEEAEAMEAQPELELEELSSDDVVSIPFSGIAEIAELPAQQVMKEEKPGPEARTELPGELDPDGQQSASGGQSDGVAEEVREENIEVAS